MAKSGLGTLDSAANFMAHPLEGKAAIDEFILTADAQQILGDRYDQVKAQLASVDGALAQGGDVHSEKLGQQMGGLLAVFVTLVVGTEASAAKGASVLSKAGIDVSSSSYKVIAADATANSIRGRVDQLTAFGQGAKETAAISSEAASVNAQAALRAKLSGLQKAQENAAVTKTLPDGRIRYYTQEVPARTEGVTRGASFATEYNPTTGSTRQWMESYDHSGNIIRVHPKSINGQPVSVQHYPPTGAELESWK